MADEELAPDGGEALELAPEEQAAEPDTPEPIANLAKELGWVPREEFRGEPEKWKPADQFIRDGRDIQQTTARELRSLREQMERMGAVTSTIIEDKVAERDAYWKTQFNQAVEDGDTEKANALLEQRPAAKAPTQAGTDPIVAAWKAKNPWFDTDPAAGFRASEVSDRLKHLPVPEQLAAVEKVIRKEYPEHFAPPAKQPPGVQTAASRNPNPSNRVKGFNDMPAASQQVARDMVRRHPGLTLEAFAKSYWSDPTNQRSA